MAVYTVAELQAIIDEKKNERDILDIQIAELEKKLIEKALG